MSYGSGTEPHLDEEEMQDSRLRMVQARMPVFSLICHTCHGLWVLVLNGFGNSTAV